jgi:hypothetical protein
MLLDHHFNPHPVLLRRLGQQWLRRLRRLWQRLRLQQLRLLNLFPAESQ